MLISYLHLHLYVRFARKNIVYIYELLHCSFTPEYIIGFNGYYSAKARRGYITAALDEAGVKSWNILPRDNALSKYPSDFDVIRVGLKYVFFC